MDHRVGVPSSLKAIEGSTPLPLIKLKCQKRKTTIRKWRNFSTSPFAITLHVHLHREIESERASERALMNL